jgi:23S rRNA pseudouridine2604 synthase
MWNTENIRVRALKRIRIADITLGDLKPGEYSILSDEDVEKLKKSLAKERIKNNKSNLMPAKELKNTRSGMKRFNTNGPVHHKLAQGLEKKVKK